jgi:type I restriction enzyme S subunit
MTGYVGEVGLVPPTENPPLLNQRVGKFILEKPGTSALGFLYCLTRRAEFKAGVESKSHGTAQANVSADGILSVPITVPSKMLKDKFDTLCEPILNRILMNHGECRTLAALRDALLPKLISGDLRVPDAERIVARCT